MSLLEAFHMHSKFTLEEVKSELYSNIEYIYYLAIYSKCWVVYFCNLIFVGDWNYEYIGLIMEIQS